MNRSSRPRPRQPYADFGQAFAKIRYDFGDTQADAAARLDVSQPYVSQLERGVNQPSEELFIRILDRYECRDREAELRQLAGRTEDEPESQEDLLRRVIAETVDARLSAAGLVPVPQAVRMNNLLFRRLRELLPGVELPATISQASGGLQDEAQVEETAQWLAARIRPNDQK